MNATLSPRDDLNEFMLMAHYNESQLKSSARKLPVDFDAWLKEISVPIGVSKDKHAIWKMENRVESTHGIE